MLKEGHRLPVGPNDTVTRYSGYLINEHRFYIKRHEINRKTQNSGFVDSAQIESYSTSLLRLKVIPQHEIQSICPE